MQATTTMLEPNNDLDAGTSWTHVGNVAEVLANLNDCYGVKGGVDPEPDTSTVIPIDDLDRETPCAFVYHLSLPPALNQGDQPVPKAQSAPPPNYELGQKRKPGPDSVKEYAMRVQAEYQGLGDELIEIVDSQEHRQMLDQLKQEIAVSLVADIAEARFPKKVRLSAKAVAVADELATQETTTETARERLKAAERAVLQAAAKLAKETESLVAKQEQMDLAIKTGNNIVMLDRLRKIRKEAAPFLVTWVRMVAEQN